MNLTHTVQDIRNFINAYVCPSHRLYMCRVDLYLVSSRPENRARPYTIGTTFPNRTLEDNTQSIEAAGLVNSVVVQRWA